MSGAAAGTIILGAGPAFAQAIEPLDIAPQSLASALYEFGSKTDRQMMFSPEMTASKTTRGISAAVDEKTALAQLLDGTGLTFRRQDDVYMIVQQGGSGDPQGGSAAGSGADVNAVEALIVTAQKREEDIQDVPIAISAFTQEDLTRSQIAGGPDLMTQVPNVTFTKTNFTSYSVAIRGIGTQAISATVDPAVAVAFNNTPFVRNRFFEQEFYDLQRVEVLRGPQGTLYGRNATAGVVNIISAKPSHDFEAKLSADVANYDSTRLEGMINIPLVEDKIALRLAGAWTKREGFVTNQLTGRQIDGRDLWSTRLSLGFEPSDRISAQLIWEHFEEDDDRLRSGKQLCKKDAAPEAINGVPLEPPGWGGVFDPRSYINQGCVAASLYADESFQTPNGFSLPYYGPTSNLGNAIMEGVDPYLSAVQSRDLRVIESMFEPSYRAKADVAQLQVSFDVTSNLTLASETAYSADFLFSTQDYNRFNTTPGAFDPSRDVTGTILSEEGVFCDPQLGCSDRLMLGDLSTAKSRQFSQEFRLSSDYDGPINFSLGGNFIRYDTEDKYYVFVNSLTLFAAMQWGNEDVSWTPGVSDNRECLNRGMRPGDPREIQQITNCIYIDPNPIGSLNDLGHNYFLSRNPYKLISYAAFGEAYYNITPELKITGGLRWTVDKKEAPQVPSWLLAAHTVGYPVGGVTRLEWREPTGRVAVDWKPNLSFTDESLLYASYAHGYKAGGANPPPTVLATYQNAGGQEAVARFFTHPKTFDAEYIDAFEMGSKNTILDGRATINLSAFYYDYQGYQISQIVDRSAINMNFDAEVWGAELEVDWRPIENLRFGFKGGYQNTRMADGSKAIDLMDRTAGDPNYIVIKAFPTVPSNCIIPVSYITAGGDPIDVEDINGDTCLDAYYLGLDPATRLPWDPDATTSTRPGNLTGLPIPGFDPAAVPNNGEGIYKDLSGNELPNAPHFTGTLTLDYTLPLPNEWLATLHTDLYYQAEAWTRVFNMEGYDKLKAYTNVNLAAIFTNEERGWNVMAYVKNIFDRDSITGAFLNSDDTGLTTNVFLTEPRLYGVRVTKRFAGESVLGSLGARSEGGKPYPITLELGGSVQRHDAPAELLRPAFVQSFEDAGLPSIVRPQTADLDWGDGREVALIYRPQGPWSISLAARFSRVNGSNGAFEEKPSAGGYLAPGKYEPGLDNFASASVTDREDNTIVDFLVGRDIGVGADWASRVSLGIRYAKLTSRSQVNMFGTPDYYIAPENALKYPQTHHDYAAELMARRDFEGAGPAAAIDLAHRIVGSEAGGWVSIEGEVGGAVLFGDRSTRMNTLVEEHFTSALNSSFPPLVTETHSSVFGEHVRDKSATVPQVNLRLGLSYDVGRMNVGAGYRWERYFDAIDGGIEEQESYDRIIDGPYFKLSVGFGG